MTHFVVLIIVPKSIYLKGEEEVKAYIRDTIGKYDENLEVEPYVDMTLAQLEKDFEEKKNDQSENFRKYRKIINKYSSVDEFARKWHGYELFDSDGNALSKRNKDVLYDWYVVGGRWNGVITQNETTDEEGNLECNSVSVKTLLDRFNQSGKKDFHNIVIDLNGVIHKRREYGWWGSYQEKHNESQWQVIYENILNEALDDYVVSLDCHI